jgi:hypothetical protein
VRLVFITLLALIIASAIGAMQLVFRDFVWTPLTQRASSANGELPASLRVRSDVHTRLLPRLSRKGARASRSQQPSNRSDDIILQLQDDVATYVCLNFLRQRVRSFVRDAVLRLIYRPDVAGVVVNAHSQGTVVAFDVLSQLSPFEARKVRWLITAGSPLRKYIDLFSWEQEVGSLHEVGVRPDAPETPGRNGVPHVPLRWTNFWDAQDPVADPLNPLHWDPGALRASTRDDRRLYHWVDPVTGAAAWIDVDDRPVDNVGHSPDGGLKAHNYWDNEPDVIAPLADLLRREALS